MKSPPATSNICGTEKRYYVVPGFARYACVYYNKSMFDEAGETYPTELFEQGRVGLEQDAGAGGNPDHRQQPGRHAGAVWSGQRRTGAYLYTTGKHFITSCRTAPPATTSRARRSPGRWRSHMELLQSKTMVPSKCPAIHSTTVAYSALNKNRKNHPPLNSRRAMVIRQPVMP